MSHKPLSRELPEVNDFSLLGFRLRPFMQRAQEMQTADPKVAYYCRMYAVEMVRS